MPRAIWTEEIWDAIADETFSVMLTHPRRPIMKNVEQAQENLLQRRAIASENARKTFQPEQFEPLYERLRARLKSTREIEGEITSLRDKVQHVPTEDEFFDTLPIEKIKERFLKPIIENLTPDDVVGSFKPDELLGSVPLSYLCGYAVHRFVNELQNRELRVKHVVETHPAFTNGKHVTGQVKKVPRVACVGFQEAQFQRVKDHYAGRCECLFINKMRLDSGLPTNLDGFVIWSNFTTRVQKNLIKEHCRKHNIGSDRRLEIFGGFNNVLESVDTFTNN